AEKERTNARARTVPRAPEVDAPPAVPHMDHRADGQRAEDLPEDVARRFLPRAIVRDPQDALFVLAGAPLLRLGRTQRACERLILFEQVIAALIAEQAAARHVGDPLVERHQIEFALAHAAVRLILQQALTEELPHALAVRRVPEIEHRVVADGEGAA